MTPRSPVISTSLCPDKSTNAAYNSTAASNPEVSDAEEELDPTASTASGSLPPATAAYLSLSRRHPCYFALGSIQSVGSMSTLLAAATTELQVRGGS
jgi:hypothetical protein